MISAGKMMDFLLNTMATFGLITDSRSPSLKVWAKGNPSLLNPVLV
jgi:hypothetical protein